MKNAVFLLVCGVFSGCVLPMGKTSDVSHDKRVSHHIGRSFVTKYDLYISVSKNPILSDYPGIEVPAGLLTGYGSPYLPYPVDKAHVGISNPYFTCVGVLPAGTNISIKRVVYYSEPTTHFIALIFKTDDEAHRTIQFDFGASINRAKYSDFGLGDRWIIGRVADEITK